MPPPSANATRVELSLAVFSQEVWHPFRVQPIGGFLSGGLRYAPTTGYYLSALQAESGDDSALI